MQEVKDKMKAYVVKYWETRGILELEGEHIPAEGNRPEYFKTADRWWTLFRINTGPGAYTSYDDAVDFVINAAVKRARALKKKAAALEKMAKELRG